MKIQYEILNWYVQHFSFPFKGWKYMRQFLKKLNLLDQLYTKKIFTGAKLIVNPSDHIQYQIFWYGYYEKEAVCTWHSFVENDSIILDVGANFGLYSIVAGNKLTTGKVYAFEPVPDLVQQFKRNIQLNELTNIEIVPSAVSDISGSFQFYLSGKDNLGMSGFHPPDNFSGTQKIVDSVILDEWAEDNQIAKLNLVKIDVEGAEINVLKGMKNLIKKFKPVIFIEISSENLEKYGYTINDVYKLLIAMDYNPFEILFSNHLKKLSSFKEADTIIFLPGDFQSPPGININEK